MFKFMPSDVEKKLIKQVPLLSPKKCTGCGIHSTHCFLAEADKKRDSDKEFVYMLFAETASQSGNSFSHAALMTKTAIDRHKPMTGDNVVWLCYPCNNFRFYAEEYKGDVSKLETMVRMSHRIYQGARSLWKTKRALEKYYGWLLKSEKTVESITHGLQLVRTEDARQKMQLKLEFHKDRAVRLSKKLIENEIHSQTTGEIIEFFDEKEFAE